MKWSIRDESLHSKMGCQLFRHMCEEYPNLKGETRESIEQAARLMVDMEHKFIDKMFEMGDLENIKATDLKEFVQQITAKTTKETTGEIYFNKVIKQNNGKKSWRRVRMGTRSRYPSLGKYGSLYKNNIKRLSNGRGISQRCLLESIH